MKVLLLGANGQLGFDIQKVYQQKKPVLELITFTRQNLDVTQVEQIPQILGDLHFDFLINCTSYHKTDEVEKNADLAFTINCQAVRKMAESCIQKNATLIHVSTDYVFNGKNKLPYTENDNVGPLNVYGASKVMGEQLALLNPKTYILRVASLFGLAGASGKGGNFIETMIKFGKEKGVLNVVNDITMSPTSTAWIAKAIFEIIQKKPEYGIYHTVNSGHATWYEFAAKIIEKAKVQAKVNPVTSNDFPTVALRPSYSVLDNSKLKNVMGDIPHWETELETYLREKGHIG